MTIEKKTLEKYINEKMTIKEIAKKLDSNKNKIAKLLKLYDIKTSKQLELEKSRTLNTKEAYENYVDQHLSLSQIAIKTGKGITTVRHWLKKYGLKTNPIVKTNPIKNGKRVCTECNINKNIDDFYYRKNRNTYHTQCKKCKIKKNPDWQDLKAKPKSVVYKGGKCEICNIESNIYDIFDFHHKDPTKKEFSLSGKNRTAKLEKIKDELDKCHLLCARCHREVHGGFHPKYIIKEKKKKEVFTIDENTKCKTCTNCNITKPLEFYYKVNNSHHAFCIICYNKRNNNRYNQIKKDCVKYKGGKCEHCGYKKYFGALDFHHTDPSQKDFGVSRNSKNFGDSHKKELDKTICLCTNCHRIEHHRLRSKGLEINEENSQEEISE